MSISAPVRWSPLLVGALLIIVGMKALSSFRRYLRSKGLSDHSISTYEEAVIDFKKQYDTLAEKNVLAWKEGLASRYKPASMAARVKGMNAYLEFNGAGIHLSGIKLPRIHHLENVISMADYHRLIRKMSDDLTEHIYEGSISAAEKIDEKRPEIEADIEARKAEFEKRREAFERKKQEAADSLSYVQRRLIRAFPKGHSIRHREAMEHLRSKIMNKNFKKQ